MTATYIADGARLAYADHGAGAPVVFLHPTPLDRDYWRPMTSALSAMLPKALPGRPGLRAIVPDLRGHGESELGANLPVGLFARVPDAPVLTMQQLARDALALLDKLAIQKAVFVGCSIGGYVLLELWRQAPRRMRGLAFICSKPQPDAEPALQRRADNIAKVRAEDVAGFFDSSVSTLLGATTRAKHPEMIAEVRARMTLTPEAVVAVQAGLAARPDSLATVATINVPVLSVAGGEDSAIAPADMEAFRTAPGGFASHVLADAGHLAAYEQPGKVAELFADWLQTIGR